MSVMAAERSSTTSESAKEAAVSGATSTPVGVEGNAEGGIVSEESNALVKANEHEDAEEQEDTDGVAGDEDEQEAATDSDADDNQFMDAIENEADDSADRVTEEPAAGIVTESVTVEKPVVGGDKNGGDDHHHQNNQVSTKDAEHPTDSLSTPGGVDAASATTEQKKPAQVVVGDATPRPIVQRTPSSSSKPFVPLPASKNWRTMALRSNGKINRIVQAALLKTLLHAIRRGSVEGVRVAIERGVALQYVDSRGRNLIMLAAKCDTDARLQIAIILSDAGCDINHKDQLGWSCLHYACASGALDVATELIRRGARVEYNPYGYGPEDFIIPKVARAKSLLQHTEQLQHEASVKSCWDYFRKNAKKTGYSVKCRSHCDLGKPLKITFEAPPGHSPLDRIRVIDMNSDVALWLQVSKNFSIPPGTVGSITLDSETLDRPSLYRVFYEKYEPTPIKLPAEVAENNFSIRNLDTGTTVSVGSVNDLVLRELSSTRNASKSKKLSHSSREAPNSQKSTMPRRLSTTRFRELAEAERESGEEAEDADFSADETITMTEIAEHPAVTSITGVYKIVGMAIEPKRDTSKRSTQLIVRRSSGQTAAVNPGDSLVAIGRANIEHAGLKHTLWELNASKRPLVLRFRRGNVNEKKSLFASIRKLSGPRSLAAIAV